MRLNRRFYLPFFPLPPKSARQVVQAINYFTGAEVKKGENFQSVGNLCRLGDPVLTQWSPESSPKWRGVLIYVLFQRWPYCPNQSAWHRSCSFAFSLSPTSCRLNDRPQSCLSLSVWRQRQIPPYFSVWKQGNVPPFFFFHV